MMKPGKYLVHTGRNFRVYLHLTYDQNKIEVEHFEGGVVSPVTTPDKVMFCMTEAVRLLYDSNCKLQELLISNGVGGRAPCSGHDHSGCCEEHKNTPPV